MRLLVHRVKAVGETSQMRHGNSSPIEPGSSTVTQFQISRSGRLQTVSNARALLPPRSRASGRGRPDRQPADTSSRGFVSVNSGGPRSAFACGADRFASSDLEPGAPRFSAQAPRHSSRSNGGRTAQPTSRPTNRLTSSRSGEIHAVRVRNRSVALRCRRGPRGQLLIFVRSSTRTYVVGRTGLEPVTPCVSCKCATGLRQRPSVGDDATS